MTASGGRGREDFRIDAFRAALTRTGVAAGKSQSRPVGVHDPTRNPFRRPQPRRLAAPGREPLTRLEVRRQHRHALHRTPAHMVSAAVPHGGLRRDGGLRLPGGLEPAFWPGFDRQFAEQLSRTISANSPSTSPTRSAWVSAAFLLPLCINPKESEDLGLAQGVIDSSFRNFSTG